MLLPVSENPELGMENDVNEVPEPVTVKPEREFESPEKSMVAMLYMEVVTVTPLRAFHTFEMSTVVKALSDVVRVIPAITLFPSDIFTSISPPSVVVVVKALMELLEPEM